MASQELQDKVNSYWRHYKKKGVSTKLISAVMQASRFAYEQEKDEEYGIRVSKFGKIVIEEYIKNTTGGDIWKLEKYARDHKQPYEIVDMYYELLLMEARAKRFDSYLLYLEKNRELNERFYLPKRKCFDRIGVVQAMQDLIDDKLDILSISLPPGTGKTTLEKFFHSAVCGWFPNEYNLFFSHSADITRMYYDGVLSMLTDADYTWNEIFPELEVTSTNAKMETINVGKYKPFQNLMCASVGSSMSGKVRASKFLFVDDLIGKIEEALNKNTLDKLWNIYTTDARQRKTVDEQQKPCKEIIIATRWSVWDVIGRLQRSYEGNKRVRFIAVPDINEETGESNFDFDVNGFTVEFFKDQEKLMDDITYRCLYKNDPIEREGLLYHEEDLRRYSSLPLEEPDAILAVCDTKAKGVDYFVLPVIYKYGEDYYLTDCLCNKDSDYELQYGKVVDIICRNNIQMLEIEANMGGDRIAHEIKERLEKIGQRCNITTKYTESNKETRIIVNAEWVKAHVLFKDKEDYAPKSEYSEFMDQLLTYSVEGKNKHDDVPDAMANFVLFVTKKIDRPQARVMRSPF